MQDWQNLVSTAEERDFISAVLDTVGTLTVVLNQQGRIVRFNRACERTTGYSFEEVRGKLLWELFLIPEEVEAVKAVFEQLRAGQFPNEYENYWVTKDGDRRLIACEQAERALRRAHDELDLRVLERTAKLEQANESLQVEITERRRVEEALRESESHLSSLMESAQHYAVYRIAFDPSHPYLAQVVLTSPSLQDLLGTPDLYDLATWLTKLHPDDLPRIVEANRHSLETGVPFDEQFRVLRPERGDWRWVHDRSTPVFDSAGRLTHFNGLMIDIT
jgi:PAS domain S-box-containing protein